MTNRAASTCPVVNTDPDKMVTLCQISTVWNVSDVGAKVLSAKKTSSHFYINLESSPRIPSVLVRRSSTRQQRVKHCCDLHHLSVQVAEADAEHMQLD